LALTPTIPPSDKRAGGDELFLREVDDAVRASDLTNLWKRYGRWLLVLLVAGLAAFGGWIIYQNQQRNIAEKQSELFIDAMDKLQAGDDKGARTILAGLSNADQPGYRAMAQIVAANLDAEKGDLKKALAAYGKIAADENMPQAFRELATIKQTTAELDSLTPQQIIDRLKPLAQPGNPWFGSAGELTAIAYMKMGKDNLAGPIFAQIAKQKDLPQSLRGRATQMAGTLGIDAVQLDEKKVNAETGAINKNGATGESDAPAKGGTK
jgi:hypothetical protein